MVSVKKFLFNYYYYLQILVLAVFAYLLVGLVINYVPPEVVAHWFWPDSYFLPQSLFLAGNFFFFTFLLQNRRLGAWVALTIWSGVFFQLAHFAWTWPLILALTVSSFLMFFWLMAAKLKKRVKMIQEEKKVKMRRIRL